MHTNCSGPPTPVTLALEEQASTALASQLDIARLAAKSYTDFADALEKRAGGHYVAVPAAPGLDGRIVAATATASAAVDAAKLSQRFPAPATTTATTATAVEGLQGGTS